MRVMTWERLADWTRGAGLLTLPILAWAVLAPGGFFWTAVLAMGVIGAGVATAMLSRSRQVPSLAQVIASAEAEPEGGAGRSRLTAILRQREGRRS